MNLLGVDIGGTKIAAGVVDSDTGAVIHSGRTATLATEGGAAVLARAVALARQVLNDAAVSIAAVGVGAGGQIDYRSGVVLSATDILPGWAGTLLAEAFREAFGVPAFADNDVNAFALGEHRFGAGRGASDAVYVTLGTGVGGAIFIGGKLHRGARGTGGELGHMVIDDRDGFPVTLEAAANGEALVCEYLGEAAYPRHGDPPRLPEPVTGAMVGEAAKRDANPHAIWAVQMVGGNLGGGLASLANILDTERFVIGGGIAELGDLLFDAIRNGFAHQALPLYQDTAIVPAALGGGSSLVGAACVALAGLERESCA